MLVRKALLQDASNVYDLVNSLSGDGTLLKRAFAEICENIRDFTVAESDGGVFLGCGALHFYGPHLCEVRSIVVKPEAKGQGAGGKNSELADRRGRRARHPVSVPVHAHSRLLLQIRFPHRGRQIRVARQDLQGLPELPAAASLRRSRDGARTDSAYLDSGAERRGAGTGADLRVRSCLLQDGRGNRGLAVAQAAVAGLTLRC